MILPVFVRDRNQNAILFDIYRLWELKKMNMIVTIKTAYIVFVNYGLLKKIILLDININVIHYFLKRISFD